MASLGQNTIICVIIFNYQLCNFDLLLHLTEICVPMTSRRSLDLPYTQKANSVQFHLEMGKHQSVQ